MQLSEAAKLWLEHHKSHSKENSIRAYRMILTQLCEEFGAENLEEITTERVLSFLNTIPEGRKRQAGNNFTLIISEISIQKLKVSIIRKTCDKSSINGFCHPTSNAMDFKDKLSYLEF